MSSKAFSAPGKAFLAGGYLVLDPQFSAYVVALSARMHCVISALSPPADENTSIIKVSSPQFTEGEWNYLINDIDTIKEVNGRVNPFIQSTISTVLHYIEPTSPFNVHITIFSDPGYHSTENTTKRGPFLYHKKPITQVPKTGLGSSAGLVTVLTTALLSHFSQNFDIDTEKTQKQIHNLAQVSHCQAQGKVGSGFDVAAATFGSIVYSRFEPELINKLPSNATSELQTLIDSTNWNIRNEKVSLPRGIKLIMGDVQAGSNTPKLVSLVQKWRKEDPESSEIYSTLNSANMALVDCLTKLNTESSTEDYDDSLEFISKHTTAEILSSESPKLSQFQRLIRSIAQIRTQLREITKRSGADIEPPEQTALLDQCNCINGVIGGVVPGAGGYDAISLLVAESAIPNLYESTVKGVEWLQLSEESEGVRAQDATKYQ